MKWAGVLALAKQVFPAGSGNTTKKNEPYVNGGATRSELEAEIKRLRKETERLRMEREILKKAAAFFANESS